jgi:valyl-tRNA synthetase
VVVSDLVEAVDIDVEKARLDKVIADLHRQIGNFVGRLSNEKYVQNAKPELVQESRDQLAAAKADLAVAQSGRSALD